MRILALEPYYGGSHRAFLDGWTRRSRHRWTVLTLPANRWKWRMRHGAWTFAAQIRERAARGERWDLLFASSMVDLAQLRGLAPGAIGALPAVVYFHENQLTYPVRVEDERDLHFGLTHFTSALAADECWFNSAFHRDIFLAAARALFDRLPAPRPHQELDAIAARCEVRYPGVDSPPPVPHRTPGPARILWAARWEHDKAPETLFAALEQLTATGADFRLSVLGERFREQPEVFAEARRRFADRIDHWGYLPDRDDYRAALAGADLFVSTARHEFFGLSAVEAVAAGAYPVLPRRLSYPEVFQPLTGVLGGEPFYGDGDPRDEASALASRLRALVDRIPQDALWPDAPASGGGRALGRRTMARYFWSTLAPAHDAALERLAHDARRALGPTAPPARGEP
jgi:glycosyltransferase involved in cell wall biosynthesis